MNVMLPAAEKAATTTETVGTPWLNMAIFAAFVAVTMVVVLRASKSTTTAADYYAGGRSFSGTQNGLAIAGAIERTFFVVGSISNRPAS